MGTPAQSLRLVVDTGSSDIWVNVQTSEFCRAGHCLVGGAYDPNSRTKVVVNNDFAITYGDGDSASGQFVKDSMYFDHRVVPDVQFGLGFFSDLDPGTFGIGYPANQAQPIIGPGKNYRSFARALINNGIINLNAYSMWLNNDDTGSILFGGVDRTKYYDELKTVSIVSDNGEYYDLQIMLHKIAFSREKATIELDSSKRVFPISVLLDSGSNTMRLPPSIVHDILEYLEWVDIPDSNPMVDCKLAESTLTLDFTFDSTVIRVPLWSLIEEWGGHTQAGTTKRLCSLVFLPSKGNDFLLGTPFLRALYVVYNLRDNEISLALAKYGATNSDIVEIGPSGAATKKPVSFGDPGAVNTPTDSSTTAETSLPADFMQAGASQILKGPETPTNPVEAKDTTISMNDDTTQGVIDDGSTNSETITDTSNTETPQSSTDQNVLTYNNDFKMN